MSAEARLLIWLGIGFSFSEPFSCRQASYSDRSVIESAGVSDLSRLHGIDIRHAHGPEREQNRMIFRVSDAEARE